MNKVKRTAFTAFVIVLALLMSGCSLVQVNEEKDRNIVVAKVNGEEIKKGDVLDQYVSSYGQTEEYDEDIMKNILESMIEDRLLKQKAKAAGYEVNDEALKQAQEEYEQAINDYAKSLEEEAGKDADPNTDYKKKAREDYENYIKLSGMTMDEYMNLIAEYVVLDKYIDELTKDLTVSDSEIEEYYNEELEFQKEYPSLAPYYSTVTVVTEPAVRRVKHVLIKLSDEDTKEISNLRTEGKNDEADALREEKLKTIESKARDVLKKALDGENFDILVEKFGEDPGMKSEENKDGYKMYRDASMMEEFLKASFAMKEGEISDLVATDYGYHIIKVYEATEDKVESLDKVREDIRNALLKSKKNEKYEELMEQWLKEADIKKYENRLK